MRNFLFYLLFFINSGCGLAIAQTPAKVVRVKDADTYVIRMQNNAELIVRLAKVDAPELKQNWGVEAMQNVRELIGGKDILFDRISIDKYGRTIAIIYVDGRSLDEILIENGWAWHYTEYDKDQHLEDLMRDASERHAGLWECGKENVCPPWLFRNYNKIFRLRYCKGCSTM